MLRQIEKWYLPLGLVLVAFFRWNGAWLPFTHGKWLAVHFIALLAAGISLYRGPKLPRMKWWEGSLLGLTLIGILCQIFWFWPRGYEFSLLDRYSFFVIVLAAWWAFRSRALHWESFWWPLAGLIAVVTAIGLYQIWQVGFPGEMPYLTVGSTFGHSNNTAQGLGLALLFWWGLPLPATRRWVLPAVSSCALAYFFFLRGRSTIIGLALGLFLLAYLRYREEGQEFFRRRSIFICAALVVLVFGGFQVAGGKSFSDLLHLRILGEKSSMVLWRSDVWRQTIRMIQTRPLGIGTDRFSFAFVPFHAHGETFVENKVADTPHNEVLRYLAEDGVALSSLYFFLIVGIFLRWFKRREDWLVILPSFAFLAVEGVTQFPFSNPFPSLFLALSLGYFTSRLWSEEWAPSLPAVARVAAGLLLAVQLFLAVKVGIARTFEHANEYEENKLSCRMVPLNWRSCLMKTKYELEHNQLQAARESAEEIVFDDPYNFTAIRYLSLVAFRQGDPLEGCFYLWRYDDLYKNHSSIHEQIKLNCQPKWISYFQARRPPAYMPRYNAYLEREKNRSFSSRFWE